MTGRASTRALWEKQDRHPGDRERLFRAVAEHTTVASVLYPGSYVDLAASFVWPEVTYVDIDRRAARFFADSDGVRSIVDEHDGPSDPSITFLHRDYTTPLDLDAERFDLLVSLYAGPVSAHCTEHLAVGGELLVNPSHGDAALASIDPRYELSGVIRSRDGAYRVRRDDLDGELEPKQGIEVTPELIERTGRGVAYTRPAFAYLFRRVR